VGHIQQEREEGLGVLVKTGLAPALIAEFGQEGFQRLEEARVHALPAAAFQTFGQAGIPANPPDQAFHHLIPLHADHVGAPEKVHELEGILRFQPVVVYLSEEAHAGGEGDTEFLVLPIPFFPDLQTPFDLSGDLTIRKRGQSDSGHCPGFFDHPGQEFVFNLMAEVFQVFETAVQAQVPAAGIPRVRWAGGDGPGLKGD
jgi:hypothetical protein